MLRSEFESLTGIYPSENLFEVIEEFYMQSGLNKQDFCYGYRFNVNGIAEKIQNEANSRAAHSTYQLGMMLGETKLEIERLRADLIAAENESEKRMREAERFQNEDEAYIHAEMKEGMPEIIVSGHSVAIFYCIKTVIDQVSKGSGVSGSEIFDIIKKMYKEDE